MDPPPVTHLRHQFHHLSIMSTTLTTETARSSVSAAQASPPSRDPHTDPRLPQCSHHPLFTCNKCGGKNARRKHKLDRRGSAQLASPISPNSRSYSPASHAYSPASSPDDAPDAASPVTATARSGSPKSLKEFALDLFVSSHPLIWKGQGTQFPMLSWVIEARKSPDNGPTLQHACEALSLMAFAKAQNRPDIRQLAIETYQDAMQKVFNILQASETGLRPQCETLMAVFVLTVYEYISDTNQGENHFLFHMCGLRALLVTCDLTTFATTTYGRDFLSLVLIQNVRACRFLRSRVLRLIAISSSPAPSSPKICQPSIIPTAGVSSSMRRPSPSSISACSASVGCEARPRRFKCASKPSPRTTSSRNCKP